MKCFIINGMQFINIGMIFIINKGYFINKVIHTFELLAFYIETESDLELSHI